MSDTQTVQIFHIEESIRRKNQILYNLDDINKENTLRKPKQT